MRIHPFIAGPAASVMIVTLIGVVAVKGWLPGGASPKQDDARPADPGRMLVQSSSCALCGTVESIRTVELRDEAGAATAAAGGPARYAYRVTVRMDDGSFRTVSLSSPPTLAVGDKVRVVEGRLVRT
jgi:hypothetical protein